MIIKETIAERIARHVIEEMYEAYDHMPETVRCPVSDGIVSSRPPVHIEVVNV